ncbi:piggyBac transposable element-derived protein 4-like [Haliotis asinina]|uniref:piggyBac transposable element-derived protein 4-like n=1 Tax=Haliotis asinina TaxID=109174 RepID=UPI0035327A78
MGSQHFRISKRKRNTTPLGQKHSGSTSVGSSIDNSLFDEDSSSDSDFVPVDSDDDECTSLSDDEEENAERSDVFVGKDCSKWSSIAPGHARTLRKTYEHSDDKEIRSQRRSKDKLAPIREIWDGFHTCLGRYYLAGDNLTVDEQLVPFRGRCSFIQYILAKPDKYGLKLFWVVDSSNCYPVRCLPYLGQEGRRVHVGLGRRVTLELCRPYFKSHRNITADNFFTDHALTLEVLSNGLTLVGTVKQYKRFLPLEFRTKKARMFMIQSLAFKTKQDKTTNQCKKSKNVTLLSTMHNTASIDGGHTNKPEIVLYCNKTKGAVDTMDQMTHGHSPKRWTKRWPMVMFTNMLDVAGIAAYTAWSAKFPQWNLSSRNPTRDFLQTTAEALMRPLVCKRKETPISRQLQGNVQDVLSDDPDLDPDASTTGTRRQCCICSTKKDRKSRQTCSMCTRNVCREHSIQSLIWMDCKD